MTVLRRDRPFFTFLGLTLDPQPHQQTPGLARRNLDVSRRAFVPFVAHLRSPQLCPPNGRFRFSIMLPNTGHHHLSYGASRSRRVHSRFTVRAFSVVRCTLTCQRFSWGRHGPFPERLLLLVCEFLRALLQSSVLIEEWRILPFSTLNLMAMVRVGRSGRIILPIFTRFGLQCDALMSHDIVRPRTHWHQPLGPLSHEFCASCPVDSRVFAPQRGCGE